MRFHYSNLNGIYYRPEVKELKIVNWNRRSLKQVEIFKCFGSVFIGMSMLPSKSLVNHTKRNQIKEKPNCIKSNGLLDSQVNVFLTYPPAIFKWNHFNGIINE